MASAGKGEIDQMNTLLLAGITALFLATGTAHAQWYNHHYAPWRIQPGFRAPPGHKAN
jgi:hypothetical protein